MDSSLLLEGTVLFVGNDFGTFVVGHQGLYVFLRLFFGGERPSRLLVSFRFHLPEFILFALGDVPDLGLLGRRLGLLVLCRFSFGVVLCCHFVTSVQGS